MIRFLFDQEPVELENTPADLTVLDWLRLYRQCKGTKEGCGSGDCGACTVVIAEANKEGQLDYNTVNSCITFVGALHGKQLLSVESLKQAGKLHPVQQAMVEQHGSQCGFCTPGFVMSLYALYQNHSDTKLDDETINCALGGNLCRCTGYRPIKEAARVALAQKPKQHSATEVLQARNIASQLQDLLQGSTSDTGFYRPESLSELAGLLKLHPDARLLGGGTDIALEVTQQMKELPTLIALAAIPELSGIIQTDVSITLGAAVSVNSCMSTLKAEYPQAAALLLRFGSDQVRNQATIGGNIGSASPIADLPPMLMAMSATLILQKGNETRELPLEEHYLGYKQTTLQAGEFIRAIRIPRFSHTPNQSDDKVAVAGLVKGQQTLFAAHKISKRHDDDISTVCFAIQLRVEADQIVDARIAYGGMAAIPVRARLAEACLIGQLFNEKTIQAAQAALSEELNPISDARASAAYRMQVAQNLLLRVFLDASTPDTEKSS